MIPIAMPRVEEEEAKAAYDVIKSGWISMGKKVEEFEKNFAKYCGSRYAISCANGTDALTLALKSLNLNSITPDPYKNGIFSNSI